MSRPPAPRVPSRAEPVGRSAQPTAPGRPPSAAGRIRTGATDGAPRWVSGLLAGAQAALLSLLVVATPALAAYVATSADPSNAEIGWSRSVAVGAVLWLMGHGAVIHAAGSTVSLTPLGITLLALFAGYASARRSAHPELSAWAAAIGGYVAVATGVVLLAGTSGPLGAGAGSVVRTLVGTVLVAAVGLGAGIVRVRRLRALTQRWWSRVPAVLRVGVTAGVMVVGCLVGVAALVTCAWVVAGRAAADDVIEGLGVDTFGGLVLALAQLAVLPNLVLWVLAWVVGPGFSVGAGTLFSPASVVSGPLPALPMLGALPPAGSEGGLVRLAPLVVVAAGALLGVWLHHRVVATRAWHCLVAVAGAAATAGILAGALTVLAGGAVGPGRLTVVGGPVLLVAVTAAGLTALGAALTAVPTDPLVRAAVARRVRGLWRRMRGDADVAV